MGVAKNLLAAWRVRVEESLGPNSSPLEHVAGMLLLRSLSLQRFLFSQARELSSICTRSSDMNKYSCQCCINTCIDILLICMVAFY